MYQYAALKVSQQSLCKDIFVEVLSSSTQVQVIAQQNVIELAQNPLQGYYIYQVYL